MKVVEAKIFSKAAASMYMTQPAVSQYVRTLEEAMGTTLLDRTSKYVRLNQAGEIVYHHAKQIMGLYTTMNQLVDDLTNKAKGSITIGASFTFGEYILPHIIAEMHQTYPDIETTIRIGNTTEIADAVLHHQLDIGIVEGKFKQADKMLVQAFARDEMVIIASPDHALCKTKNITINDLEKQVWLVRESGSGTREATDKWLKEQAISPEKVMYFGSTQTIKEAVSAGLGISFLSKWAVKKELHHQDLQILSFNDIHFTRDFSILTTSTFQTRALQIFIDLLYDNKRMKKKESN